MAKNSGRIECTYDDNELGDKLDGNMQHFGHMLGIVHIVMSELKTLAKLNRKYVMVFNGFDDQTTILSGRRRPRGKGYPKNLRR